MERRPRVSWIMPAYNAGKYIGEAIGSIRGQTVRDWELIVVDDGSSDDTRRIVSDIASGDSRVRLIAMPSPSGSAFLPRKRGIEEARADIVAPLDADDRIDPDYLESLLGVMERTGADIVYPQMFRFDGSPAVCFADGLADTSGEGRTYVRHTLDGWGISCNGGVLRRQLYLDVFGVFPQEVTHAFADELLTRYLLWQAPVAAFTRVRYHYRIYDESVCRRPDRHAFDLMLNDHALVGFVRERYGRESEEYMLAQRQNFHGIFRALRLLNSHRFDPEARRYAQGLISVSRQLMDKDVVRKHVSPRYYFLLECPLVPVRPALALCDFVMSLGKNRQTVI